MLATGFGVVFVIAASILLAATLFGFLLWLLYVVIVGFRRGPQV